MRLRPACLTVALTLVAGAAQAEPPDFGLSLDLAPTVIVNPETGIADPYLGATLSGTMSGSLGDGVGYVFSADAIHERHPLYPSFDLNYLRFSGQLNRATPLGKLRLKAANMSVFDGELTGMIYNLTDVSIGIDRSIDLTDDLALRLAFNYARRFADVRTLDRYSLNPSVGLSFSVAGLDAYLSASYSYRNFVFRERVDHFFGAGASLSKTFGDFYVGMSVNYDSSYSSIPALSAKSFTIGPNFTYNFPID